MGLTQEQLAERSGFSANYIGRLELGMSVPSLSTLARIAKALRVSAHELLTGEYEPASSDDVCSTLLSPLNDRDREYVMAHIRGLVELLLSHEKTKSDDQR